MANLIDQPIEWNSDTRRDFARKVQASMLVFNDDMARASAKFQPAELDLWRRFRDGWSKWYGSAGLFTWSLDGTVVTISAYATQLQTWRDRYLAVVGTLPSGTGPIAPEFNWTPIYWVAATAAVAGAGYLYWNSHKGEIIRGAAVKYAKSRLGLGDAEFDFSHMDRPARRRRTSLDAFDEEPEQSEVMLRRSLVVETRQRVGDLLRKVKKAIDSRSPFVASKLLREAEHLARTASPGMRRELLAGIGIAKKELAQLATIANDAELIIRGEGLEDPFAERSQKLLTRAKHALDRRDFSRSDKTLKEAASTIRRVRDEKRATELMEALGDGRMFLKRERQYRPTRELHELGDVSLVDDVLHFDEIEIGAEDPDEPDEDDEVDEASSMMTVPQPWVPEPWTFK